MCSTAGRPSRFLPTGSRLSSLTTNTRWWRSDGLYSACRVAGIFSWSRIPSVASTFGSSARGVRTRVNESNMRRRNANTQKRQDVPDYDFSNGVRGKYAARFTADTNVVVLSPDVAEVFPDSQAV